MGFFQAFTTEKVCSFEQLKGEAKCPPPATTFQLVKLSLMGCSPAEPMSVSLYEVKVNQVFKQSKLCY